MSCRGSAWRSVLPRCVETMARRRRRAGGTDAARAYHDRVAGRYDHIYSGPYWQVYERLSWEGMRRWVPDDLGAEVADLGCGTGLYGLKLLKSGFRVTFVDLSPRMLEQARRKAAELPGGAFERACFVQADIADLAPLASDRFALLVAQGDPISHAGPRAHDALRACHRVLAPGGVLVASVDNALAAYRHFVERGDPEALARFLRDGATEWLARDRAERFPLQMFTPDTLRRALEAAGFEVLDLFGKTVLPLRSHAEQLEEPSARRRWIALEQRLCREPHLLGGAAHLQVAARKR
ncbi:MAG: class I SAM-dependent methyltransferase [Planctomycetota bacterium]|nr:MAG: class I SAM-dependent methyltransferase [Planctomycetota bacterium]